MSTSSDKRGLSFNRVAGAYDRIRPGYQPDVVDDLVQQTAADQTSRILEIGGGTGKLTLSLARRGLHVLSLDVGRNMISHARKRLTGFLSVEFIEADFDNFEWEKGYFDAIVAATSFHWMNPETRMKKCHDLLRPSGFLAIIDTHHVNGGTRQFFKESQDCYLRWDPNTGERYSLPECDEVETFRWEKEAAPYFDTSFSKTYTFDVTYTSEEYASLLKTYSDVLDLSHEDRQGLIDCIRKLIDSHFGGSVTKRYMHELYVARRKH